MTERSGGKKEDLGVGRLSLQDLELESVRRPDFPEALKQIMKVSLHCE